MANIINVNENREISGNKIEYVLFNETQKIEYINKIRDDGTVISEGMLERIFTKTHSFEDEFGKDASLFTVSEIKDMYKRMSFSSIEIAANFNSQLKLYTGWCLGLGRVPDCQNHYSEIKVRDYSDFINTKKIRQKIITREELIQQTSNLNNVCDIFTLLAIFEGINGRQRSEILNLRISDFNEDGTVTLHGEKERRIVVSERLKELAFESANTNVYRTVNNGREFILNNEDPELVIKHFMAAKEDTSANMKGRRLYFRLQKCLDELGLDLSITSISDSGKIYLINEIAKQHNISGIEVLHDNTLLALVNGQFNCTIPRSTFEKKYEEYLLH